MYKVVLFIVITIFSIPKAEAQIKLSAVDSINLRSPSGQSSIEAVCHTIGDETFFATMTQDSIPTYNKKKLYIKYGTNVQQEVSPLAKNEKVLKSSDGILFYSLSKHCFIQKYKAPKRGRTAEQKAADKQFVEKTATAATQIVSMVSPETAGIMQTVGSILKGN